MAEPELYSAILCQALKDNEEGFDFKLTSLLTHSALKSIHDKTCENENGKPSQDDLYAISIAANILWAHGNAPALFNVLNTLSNICDDFDMEMPKLAITVIRPNNGVEAFGELNPYDILSGKVDTSHAKALAHKVSNNLDELKETLMNSLKDFLAEREGKE